MAMTTRTGRTVPSSPRPAVHAVKPVYEDFRPMTEWKQDEESNNLLLIYLPGFQREHLKVSTEGRNVVRARGERLVGGNKWSRFQEDYTLPEDTNAREIRAKFEGGILMLTIPSIKDQSPPKPTQEGNKAQNGDKKFIPTQETHNKSSQSPPKSSNEKESAYEKTQETDLSTQEKGKLADVAEEESIVNENTQEIKEQIDKKVAKSRRQPRLNMAPDLVLGNSRRGKGQYYEAKIDQKVAQGTMEKPKSEKDEGKIEPKEEKTTTVSAATYEETVKNLVGMKEERQLLVNVGVAVLAIVAFGAYLSSYTFK